MKVGQLVISHSPDLGTHEVVKVLAEATSTGKGVSAVFLGHNLIRRTDFESGPEV